MHRSLRVGSIIALDYTHVGAKFIISMSQSHMQWSHRISKIVQCDLGLRPNIRIQFTVTRAVSFLSVYFYLKGSSDAHFPQVNMIL